MGEWPVTDSAGNTYQAYRDHFKWEIGLVLRDWRYVARIANIDVTQLTGVSAANLINLLVRALYRLPTAPASATAIQTSDTPQVRANMGRVVDLLQSCGPDLPGPPGDEQNQRASTA